MPSNNIVRGIRDRGFGNESIATHLAAEGATFYIRLKAGRFVDCDGQRTEVKLLTEIEFYSWHRG